MNNIFDAKYWDEQFDNGIPDRDPIDKDSRFIVDYMQTPPPEGMIAHGIMNFSTFEKMQGFIKYVLLAPAVCDVLDINTRGMSFAELENAIEAVHSDYRLVKTLDPHAKAALLMWEEIDAMLKLPNDARELWMSFFRAHFEYLFSCAGKCVYGLEYIPQTDSLALFWEDFFMLDRDDEDDAKELATLMTALETNNVELIDDLISYH